MTKEYKSLNASGLSDVFDAGVDGSEPIIEVEAGEDKITIACIFPGFDLSDDEQDVKGEKKPFKEVGIDGTGFLSESGRPLMPVFRRFVNVPPGCNVEVNVEKGKAATFDDILVTPGQEEAFDGEEEHGFEFDEEAYNKNDFYPKDIVKVSPPQDVDGYNAVLVEICPLLSNPAKREIRGYGNIKATLKLSKKDKADEESRYYSRNPKLEKEGFGNLLLNPSRKSITFLPNYTWPPPPIHTPIAPYEHLFLIIYHSKFKRAARNLADWKETKGISTEIVDIEDVGNTTAGIKKYIRDRKTQGSSNLAYVLLFGDTNHIVGENVSGTVTDYYYSTPKDPSKASDCVVPDIAIGRIPIQTGKEALDVVDQVIAYEKTPGCSDPGYYDRMVVAAYFKDGNKDGKADRAYIKTMESIRSHLVSIGKDVQRVYVSDNPNPRKYRDGTDVPRDVKMAIVKGDEARAMLIDETSRGQLLIGHRGRCKPNGWTHPPFAKKDLGAIKNTVPSIFFSINYYSGKFDLTPDKSCFAEHLLKMKGGAASLIAPTRPVGTRHNDNFIKALYDGLFPGVIPTYPDTTSAYAIKNNRLGDIHNYAKMYLFVEHGQNPGTRNHLEAFHVIGDPTLELWTAVPEIVHLTVKTIKRKLQIQLSTKPTDAIIAIKAGDKIVKTIKTSSKLETVSLKKLKLLLESPLGPGRDLISVCFSAPGCRYIEKEVII